MDYSQYQVKYDLVRPCKPVLQDYRDRTPADVRRYADALEVYEKEMIEYQTKLTQIKDQEHKLLLQFKKDALEEYGLSKHPKADAIFDFAKRHGHSDGLHSVCYWLEELAELVN